ncbi:MAG: GNAT family protein [Perlabentimonas sp.]
MFYIRALELNDYKVTHRWRLHPGTWDSVVGPKRYVSEETERKWVEQSIALHEKGEVLRFSICEEKTDKMLGMIGVTNIDNHSKSFATSSMIDPESRGQGIIGKGRELVFRYMFDEMGMERVCARVLIDNMQNRKSLKKFGYVEEGVMRQAAFKNGVYKDLVIYSMLKEEFYELYGNPKGVS